MVNGDHIYCQRNGGKINDPPTPIVLIGAKGSGKTTFLSYLFNRAFPHSLSLTHLLVSIDCRDYSDDELMDATALTKVIIDQILTKYDDRGINDLKTLLYMFRVEIDRLNRGVLKNLLETNTIQYDERVAQNLESWMADPTKYLYHLTGYLLANRHVRLCVVIDNADQRKLDIQKALYLNAHHWHRRYGALVVVSLREGYWYTYQAQPPFDAYYQTVLHVTAPEYSTLLTARLSALLSREHEHLYLREQTNLGVTVNTDIDVVRLIEALLESIKYSGNEILRFIQQVTYPNVRDAIRIVASYLTSSHVDVPSVVARLKIDPKSQYIPIWEFAKAVALQNRLYYKSEANILHNLFQPITEGGSNLLQVDALAILHRQLESGSSHLSVKLSEFKEELSLHGYTNHEIDSVLVHLLQYRMIETEYDSSDIDTSALKLDVDRMRISLKGKYYFIDMLSSAYYYELVLQDTVVYDETVVDTLVSIYQGLNQSSPKPAMVHRIEAIRIFTKYLAASRNGGVGIYDHFQFPLLVENGIDSMSKHIYGRTT